MKREVSDLSDKVDPLIFPLNWRQREVVQLGPSNSNTSRYSFKYSLRYYKTLEPIILFL